MLRPKHPAVHRDNEAAATLACCRNPETDLQQQQQQQSLQRTWRVGCVFRDIKLVALDFGLKTMSS